MSNFQENNDHKPSLMPGSEGEHALQLQYGSQDRARSFYSREVLNFLSSAMQDFISRQDCLFISTSDRRGHCDCSPRFGEPGFIQVLDEKHVSYPEYRGNGVFASLGNIVENPHIGLLIIDFYRDSIGLHINGKARIVEEPERSVVVEVEEAYVHCSKHIPRLQKLDRKIHWGTDSPVAKKSDYFQLKDISLYDRLGREAAVKLIVEKMRGKLPDEKADLSPLVTLALGGPRITLPMCDYSSIVPVLKASLEELGLAARQVDGAMQMLCSLV